MIKPKVKMLSKFKNLLIKKGKRAKANTLVLRTFFLIKRKLKKNPINIVSSVLKSLTPGVTTKKTTVAGRLYHLPSPITKNKALYFSCKWLQQAAMENKELKQKTLDYKMADECFKVLRKKAPSLLLLKQHNKIVSENRPFLRFIRKKRKPRLPRRIWLKRKKIIWMSRRKKVRIKSKRIYNFKFRLPFPRKRIIKLRKYSRKTKRSIYKIFNFFKSRKKTRLVRIGKRKLAKDRLLNPKKYERIDRIRKKILANLKTPKKRYYNKSKTRYEQRAQFYKQKQKQYYKNQPVNKKNKVQRRA